MAEPEKMSVPGADIEAIDGLKVFSGWRCQENSVENELKKCGECCTTETSMKKHCREVHE